MNVLQFHRVLLATVIVGAALLVGLLIALTFATADAIVGALGGVVGGLIGAGGAALAVYITLTGQRDEDRARVNGAIVREVFEFARMVVGHLEICEHIRAGAILLPRSRLTDAMEMPLPIIYPAVADKIGLLLRPQRVVAFYTRIKEIDTMVGAITRGPGPDVILVATDIKRIVEAWIDIAHFAQLIIAGSELEDEFDQAVRDSILNDLRNQNRSCATKISDRELTSRWISHPVYFALTLVFSASSGRMRRWTDRPRVFVALGVETKGRTLEELSP
jgi:hypothetical protein